MRRSTRLPAYLVAGLLFAAANQGCSSDEETVGPGSGGEGTTTSTATGHGGATSSSSSSSTSSGGGQGGSGAGGSGGGPSVSGKPGTETVSAGQKSSSPGYTMIFTLGQPTQNQGKTTSPGYRMQGGLQGANGSLP